MIVSRLCLALLFTVGLVASPLMKTEMTADGSGFTFFSTDSLGTNEKKLSVNLIYPQAGTGWSVAVGERRIGLKPGTATGPFRISFNNVVCHATLLGHMNDDGSVRLPAILHLPDWGSFRISSTKSGVSLGYDADRGKGGDFVKIEFPLGAEYVWDVVAIAPEAEKLAGDRRFDAYRRGFLTILALNPRFRSLANHSASDPAALTFFQYSFMARYMPPLADGLTGMDLVRFTLDRHLAGLISYGMKGYKKPERYPWNSLDTLPALLCSVADYVETSKDAAWAAKNWAGIRGWADEMLAFDKDGDGLIESPLSGNAGSWKKPMQYRPANWWDTIGYGHKDAYSNALAYRALEGLGRVAAMAGKQSDAKMFRAKAAALKASYAKTFYNPATGCAGGLGERGREKT